MLIGAVFVHVDCSVPLEKVQEANTDLKPTQKRGVGFRIVSLPDRNPCRLQHPVQAGSIINVKPLSPSLLRR